MVALTAELQGLGGGDVAVGRGYAAAVGPAVAATAGGDGGGSAAWRLGEQGIELDAAAATFPDLQPQLAQVHSFAVPAAPGCALLTYCLALICRRPCGAG